MNKIFKILNNYWNKAKKYILNQMSDIFENKYVHEIYEKIAKDFSRTRYKAWNRVRKYIESLDKKSKIADIGCGNGKNMLLRPNQFYGCDMSENFVKICHEKKLNVIQANILNLPYIDKTFDNLICIAVIHHLSTEERRIQAILELCRIVKSGGTLMIQVWSLEQEKTSKRIFQEQDNLVTWGNDKLPRYYHVFKKGELEELIKKIQITQNNIKIIESFYECGNWSVILEV
jgi:ubiquinone/menaquinone biosynthesis C-methylase UbiE